MESDAGTGASPNASTDTGIHADNYAGRGDTSPQIPAVNLRTELAAEGTWDKTKTRYRYFPPLAARSLARPLPQSRRQHKPGYSLEHRLPK